MRPRAWVALLPAALGGALVAAILLAPPVRGFVRSLDTYNPTPDLAPDLAIGILVALVIGYSVYLWPVPKADRTLLRRVWWAHALFSLGPLLYYESVQDSIDGFRHYGEIASVGSPLSMLLGASDTRAVNALLWFPVHLLGGSYQASKLLFVLPGLVGCYVLARAAMTLVGEGDRRPLYLFLLFPSLFVWGSFLNKEGFTYLALSLYACGVLLAWRKPSRRAYLLVAAGVLLATYFRPWLLFILVAPLLAFPLSRLRTRRQALGAAALALGLAVVAAASVGYVLGRFGVSGVDSLVGQLDTMSHYFGTTTATGRDPPRFHDLGDVLLFLPVGMATILFGPMPWDARHPLVWAGGLESLALCALFFGGIALAVARGRADRLRSPLFLWIVLLLATWSAAYTFPLYQNVGVSIRTRTMMVPFLLLAPFILNSTPVRDRREVAIVGAAPSGEERAFRERAFVVTFIAERSLPGLVARFARLRPSVAHVDTDAGAPAALLAAFLAGVPVRVLRVGARSPAAWEMALASVVLVPSTRPLPSGGPRAKYRTITEARDMADCCKAELRVRGMAG